MRGRCTERIYWFLKCLFWENEKKNLLGSIFLAINLRYFFLVVSSPTSEDSFQFGGYTPSAAASGQSRSRGGLARPDTAPGSTKRSVRFSDELGLDDELFESDRPSTAPSERSSRRQQRRDDEDANTSGSFVSDDKKPPSGNRPVRRETKDNGECELQSNIH